MYLFPLLRTKSRVPARGLDPLTLTADKILRGLSLSRLRDDTPRPSRAIPRGLVGLRSRRSPQESQNSTVRRRRSSLRPLRCSGPPSVAAALDIEFVVGEIRSINDDPQRPQNFACGRLSNPHLHQRARMRHRTQCRTWCSSRFSELQFRQRIHPSPTR
jgi:hypothetical protein